MTISDADDGRASREAIDWLILLNDDPADEAQRARFSRWLGSKPENAAAWAHHNRAYSLLGTMAPELESRWQDAPREESRAAAPQVASQHQMHGRAGRWHRGQARKRIMAVAAIAACLAAMLAPEALLRLRADAVTATAEVRSLSLPDGSIAVLAPFSAVQIVYDGTGRSVRLLRGEAWFDVRRDPARPFHVLSGTARTTVLGTAFDVRMHDAGVRVAVERGHVRVEDGAAQADLLPGQWADVPSSSSGIAANGTQSPARTASWKSGKIVIDDRPVGEALDAIRPWFGGRILLTDHALAQRRVTGIYDPTDPAEAVRSIVGVYGGSVRTVTPWLLIVS